MASQFEAHCAKFTAEEWQFLGFQFRCAGAGDYTAEVRDRDPLDPPVPGAVAISAKGAKVCTQVSSTIVYNLLNNLDVDNCKLTFLPESSRAWALEGEGTVTDVTLLLADVLVLVCQRCATS